MKVIHTDNITSVSASGENADFPASNAITDYRTQLWKAGSTGTQYLEFSIMGVDSGKTMALAVINTNAVRVDVTVTTLNSTIIVDAESYYTEGDFNIVDLWADYPAQEETHIIKLEFVPDTGEIAQCGAVCVGESLEFLNPKYGLSENLEDKSILKKLDTGEIYYKKRDLARVFSGSVEIRRNDKFYEFLYTTIRANGRIPMAWLLADDLEDRRWVVFGRPDMPSGSHQYFDFSNISFKIEEGL